MKILWVGDPPLAKTGYGGQAALFIPRLRAAGHEVALLAIGGSAGATYETADGLRIYPTVADLRGNDIVEAHARDWRADVVLTLGDPHILDSDVYGRLPWLAWAPLDFETPTNATRRALQRAHWIWAPSEHAHIVYSKFHPNVALVPHGIDDRVFAPGSREVAREVLNVPQNCTLLACVAANKGTPSRKGFYELFRAVSILRNVLRQDILLYVHTDKVGIANGEDLRDLAILARLVPDCLRFPDQYRYLVGGYNDADVASIYRAANVCVSASHGEGFGLTAVESQLCGTPVVAGNHTANVDTCLPGSLWQGIPYAPFAGATTWCRPTPEHLAETIRVVLARSETSAVRDARRDWAQSRFGVDRVTRIIIKELEGLK